MSARLSSDALAAIRARAEMATKGPWDVHVCGPVNRYGRTEFDACGITSREKMVVQDGASDECHHVLEAVDAAFIAAARTDVPALLAHAAALEVDLTAMHRRAQMAEGIIAKAGLVEGRPQNADGRTMGRALANYAAAQAERERDTLEAENRGLREALDATPNGKGYCRCGDLTDVECVNCAPFEGLGRHPSIQR